MQQSCLVGTHTFFCLKLLHLYDITSINFFDLLPFIDVNDNKEGNICICSNNYDSPDTLFLEY